MTSYINNHTELISFCQYPTEFDNYFMNSYYILGLTRIFSIDILELRMTYYLDVIHLCIILSQGLVGLRT
jgi:hypothetical protein